MGDMELGPNLCLWTTQAEVGAGTTTAGVEAEVGAEVTGKGITSNARITRRDWMTLPLDTLVERKFLGMSLQQLELRCTSNPVHYLLNQEHAEDDMLTSNELIRVLSKTPKFRPTPHIVKPKTVASDRDVSYVLSLSCDCDDLGFLNHQDVQLCTAE
jgi:hypothetical protein